MNTHNYKSFLFISQWLFKFLRPHHSDSKYKKIAPILYLIILLPLNDAHSKLYWEGGISYYNSLSEACEAQASNFGSNAELCDITPIQNGAPYGELTGSCIIGECDGIPLAYPHWTREFYALPSPLDDNQPNICTGNPIDPVAGNKLQREQLIKIDSTYPIKFDLFYNSNRLEKWRHTFSRSLSFSATPNGRRFDFNGTALGSDPTANPESPSSLGGEITSYGAQYTAPESTNLITYSSIEQACKLGWLNKKQHYNFSWIPTSIGELRQTPISSFGAISQCYILDQPDGQVKMVLDIYDVIAGNPVGYGEIPALTLQENSYLRFTRENGQVIVFSQLTGIQNTSNTGETVEKINTAGIITYRLHTASNETEEYSMDGKLQSVISAQGHIQTLSYDAVTGLLDNISNQTGESLSVAYETYGDTNQYNRIKTITDNTSRVWTFIYDTVDYTLTSIDFPDGTTRQYHYENTSDKQLLTGITDETGHRYASWEYDENSRATLSAHGADRLKDRVELYYQDGLNASQRIVTTKRKSERAGGTDADIVATFLTHTGGGSPIVAEITGHDAIKFEHNASTGYLEYKEDKGLRTEYTNYDTKGNPGTIKEAVNTSEQRQTSYTYDPRYHSKIATITEPSILTGSQKITTNLYDDFGNNTSISINGFKPDGSTVSRTTTFEYNGPFHQLTKIDGPRTDIGDIYTIDYYTDDASEGDNRARMKRVTAPENITLYDNITYTPTGKILSYLDANNIQTTFAYYYGNDRLNTLLQENVNTGDTRLTEWTYLATGEVKTITTGFNASDKTTLTLNYDDARRLTSIVDGLGNAIEYTLDSEGNVEQENIRDASSILKKQLTQTFDNYNRLQLRTQLNEALTETWSANGTLDKTLDGKNVTTDYSYDNLHRLTKIEQDKGGSSPQTANALTLLNYDVQDNLTTVTDANNGQTSYIYDDLGNLLSETSPDTGARTYSHDNAGNITSLLDAKSQLFTYSYDALNRLTNIDAPGTEDDVTNTYDTCANGKNLLCHSQRNQTTLSYNYTAFGDISTIDQIIDTWPGYNQTNNRMGYNYDTAGRLKNLNYPSGATITYNYDTAGNINNVSLNKDGVDTILSQNIRYQPFGEISSQNYGNGLSVLDFKDQAYRPLISGTFSLYFDYLGNYDANGNPTYGVTLDSGLYLTQNYSFDEHDRLDTSTGLFGDFDYDYDKVGNRIQLLQDGTTINIDYQPQTNRITKHDNETILTDANGNMQNLRGMALSYTTDNRLKAMSGADYQYNGLGQRVVKKVKGGLVPTTRTYLYGQGGELLAETGPTGEVFREYVYLNSKPLALLEYTPNSNENFLAGDLDGDGSISVEDYILWYVNYYLAGDVSKDLNGDGILDNLDTGILFNCALTPSSCRAASYNTAIYSIHNDHLGTPKLLTNQTGQPVWRALASPFGQATVDEDVDGDGTDVVMNLRFPGQYFDAESGLHYNYFRTYDPNLGRYITSDPIGLFGGLNSYAYVGSNPLFWVDPLGLAPSWVGPTSAVAGATGGALVHIGIRTGNVAVGGVGLGLVTIGGGLQLWDALTTPTEQIEAIKDSESLKQIKENMDGIQDLIDKINDSKRTNDSCP